MKLENDRLSKEYTYGEVAGMVLKLWPKTVRLPPEETVLLWVKQLVPSENATVNLYSLSSAVECVIRTEKQDWYTDWEQLLVTTRAIPIFSKTELMETVVDVIWNKYKFHRLDADVDNEDEMTDHDDLYGAVLKPGPKLAFDEAVYRYVTVMIDDKKCFLYKIKITKWKAKQGRIKQEQMLAAQQFAKNSPSAVQTPCR